LTSFVGREHEIAAVRELITRVDVRLLTLTGAGGVGKTRLALAAASDAAERFFDGTMFVGLAALSDPALVLPTIAQDFGVRETGHHALADRLHDVLRDRQLLLLLDNLEQVADAGLHLADLLSVCPGLTILATSRVVLRLSGEHVFPVLPLLTPSATRSIAVTGLVDYGAVELFVQRARAADPSFALTVENAPTVAEIVRRLDGLPLAIELAAARVRSLSLPALLTHLDDRLHLLTGGPRDSPDRQRTLRDTIAWSYDLLNPDEQEGFRRVAVFTGGFALDAAADILGATWGAHPIAHPTTPDLIASLVDQSLLRRQDLAVPEVVAEDVLAQRYVMLETIREFALERLTASGIEDDVRRANAEYYLALAERTVVNGPGQEVRITRLEADIGNLRASLAWLIQVGDSRRTQQLAGALWEFWWVRGYIAEGRRWLEAALALVEDGSRDFGIAAFGAGALASQQGDFERADRLMAAAEERFRRLEDWGWFSDTLAWRGDIALEGGDLVRAEGLFERALAHAQVENKALEVAIATLNLGWVAAARGDLVRAETLLTESLEWHRADGGPLDVTFPLLFLGRVVFDRGDPARALALYREALPLSRALGNTGFLARCIEAIAAAAAAGGPGRVCACLLGAAQALRERVDSPLHMADRSLYESTISAARGTLGAADFAAAWDEGRTWPLDRVIAEALVVEPAPPRNPIAPPLVLPLTPREVDVLRLIAVGRSNQQIGAALFISSRTAQTHVTHVLAKLGLANRTEAAAFAHRHAII